MSFLRRRARVETPEEALEDLAAENDVAEGALLGVRNSNGEKICLFRHEGRIGAVSDNCTHQDFPLSAGSLTHRGTIECGWHGAEFDCRSGAVKRCPATDPLPVYHVEVRDGRILVGGVKP
jgi:3-phenylpropionate/trans-cinnamate dioxygenase ferredoxin component